MSAINNNNKILPYLYRQEVRENLDDLIKSFNQYAQVILTPPQNVSPSQMSLLAQILASMAKPEPAPLVDFSTKTTYVIHEAKTEKKDEKKEKPKKEKDNLFLRALVIVSGIAGSLFAAYIYGKASGEKIIVDANKQHLKALRQHINETAKEAVRNDQNGMRLQNSKTLQIHMTNLDAAVRAGESVLSQKSQDTKSKVMLATSFIALGILAVVGAVINSIPLMTLSGISAVVLTGFLLVRMGFGDATNELIAAKAKKVAQAFQALRDDLVKYNGFEDKNLPAPSYYRANVQPVNVQYPQVATFKSNGPGSYGMDFVAPDAYVHHVLAGESLQMPHVCTPEPSAPPVDD